MQDSQLLAIYSQDLENSSSFGSLEAQRRLGDSMQININANSFYATDSADPLYSLRSDDYLQMELVYYF